jgi:hypothetical protein
MPSPNDTGTRRRNAPVEQLKVIDGARALRRFRAFPDDTGIALDGDKRFARVGPILKLLDGHVVAGLAAGTASEERPRDIDHMQRALRLGQTERIEAAESLRLRRDGRDSTTVAKDRPKVERASANNIRALTPIRVRLSFEPNQRSSSIR